MNLERVTMTGADDSVDPAELIAISRDFPYAEWGLLFSKGSQSQPRYPSPEWIESLLRSWDEHSCDAESFQLSAHVCGSWMRDALVGNWEWLCNFLPSYSDECKFSRIQLNRGANGQILSGFGLDELWLLTRDSAWQLILQVGAGEEFLIDSLLDEGIDAVGLYDTSGGRGFVPHSWPWASPGRTSGYEGGLGPDNLERELHRIAESANGEPFWVDMESSLRCDDGKRFDLDAVIRCLEIAAPYVKAKQPTKAL